MRRQGLGAETLAPEGSPGERTEAGMWGQPEGLSSCAAQAEERFNPPVSNPISEPEGTARELQRDSAGVWHHLVAMCSETNAPLFLLFPNTDPLSPLALGHLPA